MRSFKILEQPRKARQKKQSMHGCGEYELSENLKHLQVEPNKWKQMSLPSRQKHIDKFWSAEIDAQNFEVLVDKILREMPPETTCHEMAVFECSSPPPSLAGGKVTCDCYNYSSMQTCAHSVAAAENLGCLEMFLHWRERCSTKIPKWFCQMHRTELVRRMVALTLNEEGVQRRTAVYGRKEERSAGLSTATVSGSVPLAQSRLFTEIHQYENQFVLIFVLDDKEYKKKKRWQVRRGVECSVKRATMNSRQVAFHRTIWPYVITNDGVTQIRTTTMGHGKCPIKRQQSSTTSIRKIALNHDIHISLVM